MSELIVAENLHKCYGKVVAVKGLNLKVNEGSIMGLIGPNGAGKTTTIKIILGLLRPDEGKVAVFGENPWDNPKIREKIGVIYEKAYFPSHHKVLDYLKRTCRIFGVQESRAREVLELVDLDAYEREIRGLSAGMLQKFAIAHALVHNPKLIIADEPASNLDPEARNSLLELILSLHKEEDVTFLISSHILPELSRVCDSVAIIDKGRVLASGKLVELFEKYSAKAIRITTNKPEAFAEELRKLSYVKRLSIDSKGVSLIAAEGTESNIYEDAPKIAKKISAVIMGIELGTASLEQLYYKVVSEKEMKR
ncbi:ABC transporter ATP-binding protein [Candidatus Bathyarchaeota archaeon]|nr:ABC transporter ATP-binding protein [Candidatus Bathyarchaeota archaeon]